MSERPGWRVENGKWVIGKSDEPILAVTSDGQMQVDWPDLGVWVRLDRAEAGTLARLLDAYAETGTVPMDGAVPKTEADRLRALLERAANLYAFDIEDLGEPDMEVRAMEWLCDHGWVVVQTHSADGHRRWRLWHGDTISRLATDDELVACARAAGWTE